MKKRILVISLALFSLLAITTITIFALNIDSGVKEIGIKNSVNDSYTVFVKWSDISGYSVATVDENEKMYRGERLVEYDGDIGKYRIKIMLSDADLSQKLLSKYSKWEAYDVEGTDGKLRFKIWPNSDHGVIIYIGSDTPMEIKTVNYKRVIMPFGTVKVQIKMSE